MERCEWRYNRRWLGSARAITQNVILVFKYNANMWLIVFNLNRTEGRRFTIRPNFQIRRFFTCESSSKSGEQKSRSSDSIWKLRAWKSTLHTYHVFVSLRFSWKKIFFCSVQSTNRKDRLIWRVFASTPPLLLSVAGAKNRLARESVYR